MTTRHPRNATTLSVVLALVGSVSLLAGSAHGQAAVTVFASCTGTITISAPGHYKLDGGATRALACPAAVAPGIRITASRVHLDLGATRFSRTNGTVGILVSSDPPGTRLSDVHITGPGAVVGFTVGIQIDLADDSEVRQVTVANSITHGIEASSVRGLELTQNTLTRNGWFGLNLVGSEENKVRNNVVSANGIARGAITMTTPASLALTLNTPLNQIGVGIAVLGGSDNFLDRNSVTGNFGIGIAVDGNSIFNKVRQNQAAGNQTFGQAANAGRFTNLFIGAGSTGNEVTNNVLLSVEDDNECSRNLFSNNTIITTYSNNGTRTPVGPEGTYLSPLSLVATWVTTPSVCIS